MSLPPSNIPEMPAEIQALAQDVQDEIMAIKHAKREHGSRSCYTAGCRGPLCKRTDRENNRIRYQNNRAKKGKPYEPSDLRRDNRNDELDYAMLVYTQHRRLVEIIVRLRDLYSELEETG